MPQPKVYVDEFTGLKRKLDQRPEGMGDRFNFGHFAGWEVYRCNAEDCPYDTFYSDQADLHYYSKHELPAAQEQAAKDAAARLADRAQRMKPERL